MRLTTSFVLALGLALATGFTAPGACAEGKRHGRTGAILDVRHARRGVAPNDSHPADKGHNVSVKLFQRRF